MNRNFKRFYRLIIKVSMLLELLLSSHLCLDVLRNYYLYDNNVEMLFIIFLIYELVHFFKHK